MTSPPRIPISDRNAMHPLPTSGFTASSRERLEPTSSGSGGDGQCAVLAVDSIGYLVPRDTFDGTLHSVFARSCNIAVDGLLINLCVPANDHPRGPATMRLAAQPALPLERLFETGEPFTCRHGIVRTRCVRISLRRAGVWRPASGAAASFDGVVAGNLRLAHADLGTYRVTCASVLEREAAATVAALAQACHALDRERALPLAERLIGWGEGLTPAGDDYLVGLLAGLDLVIGGDARRHAFRNALAAAIDAASGLTTPVGRQCLRLAVRGHRTEALCTLCDALTSESRQDRVKAALERVLAIGATSGADTAAGLLAGIGAWCAADFESEDRGA